MYLPVPGHAVYQLRPSPSITRKTKLVMKLTIVFLLLATLAANARGFTQRVTLKVKDAPLEQVLRELKQQTGYSFVYTLTMLKGTEKVSLSLSQASLQQALDACLKNQPLEYQLLDKAVVIRPKKQTGNLINTLLESMAPADIKGSVKNEKNEPLAGAYVKLKNAAISTITDEKGTFRLSGIDLNNAELEISFIGYVSQTIAVKGRTDIHIILTANTNDLGATGVQVVSTGYQFIPKDRATGSFGYFSAKDIEKKVAPNILERLEGEVAGLLVNVGQPDRSLTKNRDNFTIRGTSTINSEKKPLIVLDGFPTELDLVNINPLDIESITVLRDAAAASIWGVRAANGVIVITTKKGSFGNKPQVGLSSIITTTGKPRLNYLPVMNAAQYLDMEKELVDKNILPGPSSPLVLIPPPLTTGASLYLQLKSGAITQQQYDAEISRLSGIDVKQQYQQYLLQAPFAQQHTVSVSGGSPNVRNYVSLSYSDEHPNAQKDYDRRFIVSFNNETRISSKLSFTAESMLSLLQQKMNGIGLKALQPGSTTLLPYDQLADANGNGLDFAYRFSAKVSDSLAAGTFLPWKYNYLNELSNADNTSRSLAYRLAAGLHYNFLGTLSADVKYMMEKSVDKGRNFFNADTYTARNLVNSFTTTDTHVKGIPVGGILDLAEAEQNNYSVRGQVNFNPNFGPDHRLDLIAGAELRQTISSGYGSRIYGYDDRLLSSMSVNYTLQYKTVDGSRRIPYTQTFTNRKDRYSSAFANFTYTYKGRYSLSGSVRKDDSNLFGASDEFRSVPLWSVGGLWRMREESFLQQLTWLSRLNIRATVGYNGNVNKETSPYLIIQPSANIDPISSYSFATVFNPANPLLRWEKVRTFNTGADFSLFGNRINGSVDVYWRKSLDLLGQVTTNPTYGFTSLLANQLQMTSKGIDLSLQGTVGQNSSISWAPSLTFSYNINKVTKAYFQQNTTDYYTNAGNPIEGKPLGSLYTYRFAGLNNNGNGMIYNGKNEAVLADLTTFTNTDLNAITYQGTTTPPYFGGLGNSFRYKNFELYTLFTFKAGHKFIRPGVQGAYNITYTRVVHADMANRWKKAGDEQTTNVPAIDPLHTGYFRYNASDLFVENASYIRWRDITLTYHVPVKPLGWSVFQSLSVSVTGRNLALWTASKSGIDPDYIPVNTTVSLPPSKSFVFSVRANF